MARDFTLGDWLVQPSLGRISRGDAVVRLRPQLVDVLLCLARAGGRTLSRAELLETVWRQRYVAESGLGRCMAELRQALGDAAQEPRYIETIPKRGYRLVAPVSWLPDAPADARPPSPVDAASADAASPDTASADAASGGTASRGAASAGGASADGAPGPAPAPPRRQHRIWMAAAAAAGVIGIAAAVGLVAFRRPSPPLVARSSIVLAFENKTSDPVFDEALPLALAVQLEQSPALAVLSEQRVREELRHMGRGDVTHVTRSLAIEVCQRAGAKAVLAGSISPLGRHYVIGLDALACESGEELARQQVEVDGKEQVLTALGGAVAALREARQIGSLSR